MFDAQVYSAFLSTLLKTALISSGSRTPSSMYARASPSITVATPPTPAIKTAFHKLTPAIAPAPTTDNPLAPNTARMRRRICFTGPV